MSTATTSPVPYTFDRVSDLPNLILRAVHEYLLDSSRDRRVEVLALTYLLQARASALMGTSPAEHQAACKLALKWVDE